MKMLQALGKGTKYVEIIQVQVSRAKTVGGYHLMQGENPIYICSFDFTGEVS